jgi:hypothetical protein
VNRDVCTWAEEALFEARDGLLEVADAERLRHHLMQCGRCAALHAWDQALSAEARPVAPSHNLTAGVLRRVRRRATLGRAVFAALAASVVLLISLVTLYERNAAGRQHEQDRPAADRDAVIHQAQAAADDRLFDDSLSDELLRQAFPLPVSDLRVLATAESTWVATLEKLHKEIDK